MTNSDYLAAFFHVLLPIAYEVTIIGLCKTSRLRNVSACIDTVEKLVNLYPVVSV